MGYVYIMRRGDGWHKIGCSEYSGKSRLGAVSGGQPRTLRPVTLVREFAATSHRMIEAIAHAEMARRGYSRVRGQHTDEWFPASASACIRAINRAVQLYEHFGSHGWLLVRKKDYWAMFKVGAQPRTYPVNEWPAETVEEAKRVWFSKDYQTNVIATKHLPKGMTAKHAWNLFGASGRPFKPKRR